MLADNIARLREQHGLTQKQLAEKLHVVRQTVSKWEKGSSIPDAETLAQLAELFGTTPNALLDVEAPAPMNAEELTWRITVISEQLRTQQRSTSKALTAMKRILIALLVLLAIIVAAPAGFYTFVIFSAQNQAHLQQSAQAARANQTLIDYKLDGEAGQLAINYDPNDPSRPISYFGSEKIAQAVNAESYLNRSGTGNEFEAAIYAYIESQGGTITQVTPNY